MKSKVISIFGQSAMINVEMIKTIGGASRRIKKYFEIISVYWHSNSARQINSSNICLGLKQKCKGGSG